jgi:hypothetical protein
MRGSHGKLRDPLVMLQPARRIIKIQRAPINSHFMNKKIRIMSFKKKESRRTHTETDARIRNKNNIIIRLQIKKPLTTKQTSRRNTNTENKKKTKKNKTIINKNQ